MKNLLVKKFGVYFFLSANLFIILFFWWHSSGTLFRQGIDTLFLAVGRLIGLFAVCGVLIQVLLIGRTMWMERLFGQDKLARIHHLNGYYTLVFILLDPILLTI